MLSARWKLSLEGKDQKTKERASEEALKVHHAIQELENAELATIRDKLLENEKDLAKGREKLGEALEDLKKTKDVLNAIAGFLGVVARIVKFII